MTIGENYYFVNHKKKNTDVSPIIVNGRTMVPMRVIAEALGANVEWNDAAKTAMITLDGKMISAAIGVKAPGMDAPPAIMNDRTMVPLRYISEAFGANVLWGDKTKTIRFIDNSDGGCR